MHAQRLQRLDVPGQRLQFLQRMRFGKREDPGLSAPQAAQVRPAAQILAQFMRH